MALKNGRVNSLNTLGLRKVSFPAHHFHYTIIPKYSPIVTTSIDKWIYQNLNGRYYVGQCLDISDNAMAYMTKIGFEQEKELSFFRLTYPHLR
jgi:hypothetical protein